MSRQLWATILLLSLLVSGCALSPRTPPASTDPIPQGASANPSAEAARTGFTVVDRALVPTLRDAPLAGGKVQTKVPSVPALRTLTTAMGIVRGQYLRSRAGDEPFELDWVLISSGKESLGFLLTVKTEADKVVQTRMTAVWFDNRTNRAVPSAGLVRPGFWPQLTARVADLAKTQNVDQAKVTAALASPAFPLGTGPALGFAANGDMVVSFSGRTVKDAPEPVQIVVPSEEAVHYLTEFGLRGQAGAKAPAANSGQTTVPTQPDPDLTPPTTSPSQGATPSSRPEVVDDRPNAQLTPDCRRLKCVALTFDDGPGPETTAAIRHLQAAKVGATFFVLGTSVQNSTAGLAATALAGMDVESHTWVHTSMPGRTDAQLTEQVAKNADAIEKVTGLRPTLVRPPYGAKDARVAGLVGGHGGAIVNWSIDTLDWQTRDTAKTVAAASNPSPGDIILLHDIHATSVAAVPGILTALKQKGFVVVPVTELAPPGSFQAGVAYCSSPLRKNSKC